MNKLLIVFLLISLLVLGAVVVSAITTNQKDIGDNCETCGNQCTLENNCGSGLCGAITAKSSCGCNR